jgi:hypothetical protein
VLSNAWTLDERRTVRAAVGLIVDGSLRADGGAVHDMEPGGLLAAGFDYQARRGDGIDPFVDLSVSVSASWAKTIAAGAGVAW